MSVVTDILFFCRSMDEDRIDEVNSFFEKWYGPLNDRIHWGLVSVNTPLLPSKWYGGSRPIESALFMGAYNAFELRPFIDHLRTIDWEFPEDVQIIVRGHEQPHFKIIFLNECEPFAEGDCIE